MMILVDTSIWIDHLRGVDAELVRLLGDARILVHPFVIGEIALGHVKRRRQMLDALAGLPQAVMATDAEVLAFIETADLGGTGIGYLDAHLLASAKLTSALLWTRDKRLVAAAGKLGLAHAG